MQRTAWALAALLFLSACNFGDSEEEVESKADTSETVAKPASRTKGKFSAGYAKPKQKKYRELHATFSEDQILEEFAAGLNDYLAVPRDVLLTTGECGEANAFYDPESHTITLCYELIEDLADQAEALELDEEEAEDFIAGSMVFILLHEIGHALVHVLDLPVTGKEEDAVDQLAAVLLMDGAETEDEFEENADLMSNAALWFSGADTGDYDSEDFADEHSLDDQRYYNLMCWIYGADPEAGADIIEDELLPAARAERCEAEYAQISKAWTRLLAPYAKG